MVRSDETRKSDSPAPRHSRMPTSKGGHSSRRAATSNPMDLQGQLMEVRESPLAAREPLAVREKPVRWWKGRPWVREEPPPWQAQPTGLRAAATGPRPTETGLGPGAWAWAWAALRPWMAARSAH
jgi:hypothetical protein